MLSTSTHRAAAAALTMALSACAGPSRERGAVPQEDQPRATRGLDPDQLTGERPWNVEERLVSRQGGETVLDLAREVVVNGIYPTVKRDGEQWYQIPAQGGGSYVVKSELVNDGRGITELRVRVIPFTPRCNAGYITELRITEDGEILGVPVGEKAIDPMTRALKAVRTTGEVQSLMSHLSYHALASAGTNNALPVKPEDRIRLDPIFANLGNSLEALHR